MAYRLDLPGSSKIHPIFHVSLLKLKVRDHIAPLLTLPPIDCECVILPKLKKILQRRMKQQGHRVTTEVLVQWVGLDPANASWESLWKLRNN